MSPPRLSKRAQEALKKQNPVFEKILGKLGNLYSAENPDGCVNIGIAENSLMHDWLTDYFSKDFKLVYQDLTYGDTLDGSKQLQRGLCKLFAEHFNPRKPVEPSHLTVGTGASAVLDQVAGALCDEGEGIMITRPYYSGFQIDFAARSRAVPIEVEIPKGVDVASSEVIQALEERLSQLKDTGGPVPRAVLLCNPHNPLGFCHPRATILAYMRFCEKHDLHLLSDEIYALSVFSPAAATSPSATASEGPLQRHDFVSVLSIDPLKEAGCDPARVHVIYGMSKDFGANGLRIGCLVSQDFPDLAKSLSEQAIFRKTSSASDNLWSKLLLDEEALPWFISENRRRMAEAYDHVTEFLHKFDIPYRPSYAGHFIWIDVGEYLPERDKDGKPYSNKIEKELALFATLLDDFGLFLAPGQSYRSTEPGWFRLTFAMRRDYLDVGLDRFGRYLESVRASASPGKKAVDVEEARQGVEAVATSIQPNMLEGQLGTLVLSSPVNAQTCNGH